MDKNRQPCAAVTMVFEDYDFLQRWVDYYAAQIGRENIFIVSHGGDPEHAKIGEGCTVINIPRDKTMFQFDRKRWSFLANLTNGLLAYYNWVITSDVDEVVLVDPDVAPGLVDYLRTTYPDMSQAPAALSVFCLELVHNKDIEPEPIEAGVPILARRRVFRPNANYSKPCVIRQPGAFTPGGHSSSHGPRVLPDGLFLLHLRFFDHEFVYNRVGKRVEQLQHLPEEARKNHGWSRSWDEFLALAEKQPSGEDVVLQHLRDQMVNNQKPKKIPNRFSWNFKSEGKLYSIPERFSGLF